MNQQVPQNNTSSPSTDLYGADWLQVAETLHNHDSDQPWNPPAPPIFELLRIAKPFPNDSNPHYAYEDLYYNLGENPDRDSACPICYEDISKPILTLQHKPCGNCFHVECLEEALKTDSEEYFPRCPLCRHEVIPKTGVAGIGRNFQRLVSRQRASVDNDWSESNSGDDDYDLDHWSESDWGEFAEIYGGHADFRSPWVATAAPDWWTEEDERNQQAYFANESAYDDLAEDVILFIIDHIDRYPQFGDEAASLLELIPQFFRRWDQIPSFYFETSLRVLEERFNDIVRRCNEAEPIEPRRNAVVTPRPVAAAPTSIFSSHYGILSVE